MPRRQFRIARDIIIHFFVTVILSLLIYIYYWKLTYAIAFTLGSIFIDLDHLIDHFLFYKNKFSLRDFFIGNFLKSSKIYLFLHSWELVFFLSILSLVVNSRGLLIFSIGLATHLLIDNFQRRNKLFCFFLYRKINNFDARILLPEDIEFIQAPVRTK